MSEVYDDEVSQLLNSWGLSDLKAKFKANYIIREALEYLTEDDIVELIPKIGQRAIFRGRLQEWRQQNQIPAPVSLKPYKTEPQTQMMSEKIDKPIQKKPQKFNIVSKPTSNTKSIVPAPSKPAIQSKVQQFYIPTPPSLLKPIQPNINKTNVPKADLTPFVTSIIRVETNCDKMCTQSSISPPSRVPSINRTRILQKLNQSPKFTLANLPRKEPLRIAKEEKFVEEKQEDPNVNGDQPDARHLYPIVKLETEQSWNGYFQTPGENFLKPIPEQEMDMNTEGQQNGISSSSFEPDCSSRMEPDTAGGFDSENDNQISPFKRMPKAVVRLRRKRLKKFEYKIDVRNILMNCDAGRHILEYYETNEHLDAGRRKLLIDTIVQNCWINKICLSPRECKLISQEIIELFPNERQEYYFTRQIGKSPKSPIYNKYRNMHRRLRIQKRSRNLNIKRPKLKPLTETVDVDDTIIIS